MFIVGEGDPIKGVSVTSDVVKDVVFCPHCNAAIDITVSISILLTEILCDKNSEKELSFL
jgi:glutaredoxin